MRVVIVSGPTQVSRAGQSRTAVVSRTSAIASSAPRSIWPAGPASSGAGEPVDRLRPKEGGHDRAVGIGRDDDDGQGAAGPGDIGEAPDARLALGGRDRAFRGGTQDDGSDGQARPSRRYVTRSVPHPTDAAV